MPSILLVLAIACGAAPERALAQTDDPYTVEPEGLRHAARSLVVAHCIGSVFGDAGIAFAYRDRTHVLTLARRGSCRDSVYVTAEGERHRAHRAQRSDELGIVLLELDRPLPDSIVPLSAEGFVDPVRGEPLGTFSFAWDHVEYESPFGVVRTTVEADDPLRFVADLAAEGAPVIDRTGHFLGMFLPRYVPRADEVMPGSLVHVDEIEGWLADRVAPTPTRPRITFGVDTLYGVSFGRGDVIGSGGVLGLTTIIDDRLTLRGELGVHGLTHADEPNPNPPLGVRITAGSFVGLRAPFYFEDGPSLVLSAELGAVWGYEDTPPGPGMPTRVEELFFRPAARVGARYGTMELGYELQLDVEDPARSLHTIQVGITFE